jgi:hypothetical protein
MFDRTHVTQTLETQFRELTTLLYDTRIDPALGDAAVAPLLAEQVQFTDPWQQASGRKKYRIGIAGFHAMFRFHLDIAQLNVQLAQDNKTARVLVDGVMQLQPLGRIYTYPLRTILVYDLTLTENGTPNPTMHIVAHEEMWSLAEMIANVPLGGTVYKRLFRPAFARGFLAASWLSAKARGMLPPQG